MEGKPHRACTLWGDDHRRPRRDRLLVWCAAAVIVMAGVAAYSNSFDGTYIDIDDLTSILHNQHIRSLCKPWRAMALPPYELPISATVSGRPLLGLSFALTYQLCGTEPWGYHLFNLALHCVAALLAFGCVRRTLQYGRGLGWAAEPATWAAAATALLWVVHPLNTQAVTYMVQRAEVQAGVFYLLTLYCAQRYMYGESKHWRAGALVACTLGVLTKQILVTAPLLVYLYDVVFVSGSFRGAWRARRGMHSLLWLPLALLASLQLITLNDIQDDFYTTSPWAIAAINPAVILHYLRLSIWPRPLIFAHLWTHRALVADIIMPWLIVCGALMWGAWGVWRARWWGYLLAWFFLILAPTTSIYPMKHMQAVNEHRMYLSLLAVLLGCVAGVARLMRWAGTSARRQQAARIMAACACALAVIVYTGMTRARNEDYHDYDRFWLDSIAKQPAHWNLRRNYADILLDQGRTAEALAHYDIVIALAPHMAPAYVTRGKALVELGRLEEAISNYLAAAQYGYHADLLYLNAANTAERLGETNRAIAYALMAAAAQPKNAVVHARLGAWYQSAGDGERAERHAARAAELLQATLPARFHPRQAP